MVHIPCKDNAHEFVTASQTVSNGSAYSWSSAWKQCRICGQIKSDGKPSNMLVNVYDLSSVAKQRRKEGSL
jgi:hypothetical protein